MPFLGKTPAQIVDPEVDIDGGSIDGATIGATSASAATVTTFTSTGIDDNATSTAITIDASQNVGIGIAPTDVSIYKTLELGQTSGTKRGRLKFNTDQGGITFYGFENGTQPYLGIYTDHNSTYIARLDSDGLKFGNDSAAANALDDYEEGTWTPSISSSGTPPTITAYARRTGRYTKIGDTVRFQLFIEFTCTAIGTGLAYVSLPFAGISGDSYSAVSVAFNNVFTIGSTEHFGAYTESAQDRIYFTSNSSLLNIGTTGSGLRVMISGVYEVS